MAKYAGGDWLDSRIRPVPSPSACEELERHRSRIQMKLRTFLPPHEAQDTAVHIYRLALTTQEEIGRILRHPVVNQLYAYDGRFFTARHTRLFHTAFDGLHVLGSLNDSHFQAFFRGMERRGASRRLLDAVSMHAWTARVRRMNWEEFQTLGLVPQALLDQALLDQALRDDIDAGPESSPAPMSLEQQSFFQAFEKQML